MEEKQTSPVRVSFFTRLLGILLDNAEPAPFPNKDGGVGLYDRYKRMHDLFGDVESEIRLYARENNAGYL